MYPQQERKDRVKLEGYQPLNFGIPKPQSKSTTIKAAWTQMLVGAAAVLALFIGEDSAVKILSPELQETILYYVVPLTTIITGFFSWRGRVKASSVIKQ